MLGSNPFLPNPCRSPPAAPTIPNPDQVSDSNWEWEGQGLLSLTSSSLFYCSDIGVQGGQEEVVDS